MPSKLLKFFFFLFLIIYFLYLILSRIPAEYAAVAIHKAAPNVWLNGITGSFWQGAASSTQVDVARANIALGQTRWKINPWSLLILSPCVQFEMIAPGQMIRGKACHSPFIGTQIKGLEVEAPVAIAQVLLPMRVDGHVSVNILAATVSGQTVKKMDGQVSWLGAKVHDGNGMINLGSFAAKLSQANSGIQAKLFELDGPIGVDLMANWAAGQESWKINGTVSPKEGAPETVTQALQLVAEEKEPGKFTLIWPNQ
ncbi:type II secretion system protein N [Teredinibacter sp. KSP-S5-2]|uniref:type II secretion system protein N n=1 Tax=Teredinibacter sp. KSP-S5-2 TaxID=3034506 RepID=UPI0029349B4E|nr:type II secretion system protein N [Teredinibacter sp. KSP-S5-2]WNO08970.1 type II secretion system protein N [Teredinibacter sp. KSP-S5-2]